ncbi:hypothetical protein ACS0PU_006372 [Formica fusca]
MFSQRDYTHLGLAGCPRMLLSFPRSETNYRCSVKPSSRGGAILRIIDDMLKIAYLHRRFVDDLDERGFPSGVSSLRNYRRATTFFTRRTKRPRRTTWNGDIAKMVAGAARRSYPY